MEREWVVSLRDQCRAARVPFFFKQWGGAQKKKRGRELGGRVYNAFPPAHAQIGSQARLGLTYQGAWHD